MNNFNLSPLNLSALHHSEFGQFITRFYEDFAQSGLDDNTDPDFKILFDGIQAQLPTFNGALKQIKASEESEKIAQLDKVRDDALQNLRNALKPYHSSKIPTEAEAYKSLSLLLAEYKETQNANYEAETNELNMLVSRLESSSYEQYVIELAIGKFVTRLKDANIAFNDLFSQRSFNVSQKVVYDVKALRKTLSDDYKIMAQYIAGQAPVKANTFYKDVLGIINNGRTYFSTVILSRRTARKPTDKSE